MTGLGALTRLALRRNRAFYLLWLLALSVTVPVTAAAYETIVPPGGGPLLDLLASNPTMRAMLGPPTDLSTPGGFTVWRVGTFVATVAGVMALLGVIRSTRADEEEGRTELLRSGVVDRHAPLTAGVLVALLACAALGVAITVGMIAVGEPVAGSIAFGLGTALVAAVFAGVGAVAAQVSASGRGARGLALAVLGLAYVWRAVTDAQPDASAAYPWHWASPLEWMALSRPYADERWWVLALPAALAAGLVAGAFALESRRDHGAGLRSGVAPGRGRAPSALLSPMGLAWRLQRGSVLGWAIGLGVFALAMGSLSGSFGTMLKDLPQLEIIMRRMGQGAGELLDAFFVAMLGIMSILVAILAVLLWHRLAGEERRGHAELLLSTATTRTRLALSHLLVAALVPVVLFVLVGVLIATPESLRRGDLATVGDLAEATLALAPGGLLVLGLAVLVHGWAPRLEWAVWLLVGWSLFVVWIGAAIGLPRWLTRLTPWEPLPTIPVESWDWTPIALMTVAAVALMALGVWGYRRRDLHLT